MTETSSLSISVDQQKTIINCSNLVVAKFAKSYADLRGFKNFFSKEDIEDIAGDTIYKACRSFDSFDPSKGPLSAWIYSIAVNNVITAFEYKVKRIPISYSMSVENHKSGDEFEIDEYLDPSKGSSADVCNLASEYDTEKELCRNEFEHRVREVVSKLSVKDQRFEQMLEHGYTPKEMALVENCTPNAASRRIWSIRQSLKQPLTEIARELEISYKKLAS